MKNLSAPSVFSCDKGDKGDRFYKQNKTNDLENKNFVTPSQKPWVTPVTAACLDHFVTLVTDTKIPPVTTISREVSPLSPLSHEKNNDLAKFSENRLVFEWLTIALEEGHIEPSQPSVGRIVGWPQRKFFVESLYVDFIVWNRKQGRYEYDIPNRIDFSSILDHIFIRSGDFYVFPPLETCRAKFQTLRKHYEPA